MIEKKVIYRLETEGVVFNNLPPEIHRYIEAQEARVRELEQAMVSILHMTNCYDGNFPQACDNVAEKVRQVMRSNL